MPRPIPPSPEDRLSVSAGHDRVQAEQPDEAHKQAAKAQARRDKRASRGFRERLATRWRLLTRLPVLLMTACALLLLGSVQAVWHIASGVSRSLEWQAEADRLKGENAQLQEDIRVLQEAQVALQTPEYLGEVARCLGFVGEGETVLVADGAPTGGAGCDTRRLP